MKKENYWLEFEKTGCIEDYLNYVACTSEQVYTEEVNMGKKEGGEYEFANDNNGNGTSLHANRRV